MQNSNPHILGTFEAAIVQLGNDITAMGSLALRNFDNAATGLLDRDVDLLKSVIADDEEIDEYEIKVDRDGFDVILRYQPVASDLRNIVSAIKMSTNLERIGDQAVTIARRGLKLSQHDPLPQTAGLKPLFDFAREQISTALRAYLAVDTNGARNRLGSDSDLDRLCKDYERALSRSMAEVGEAVRGYLNLVLIGRAIERVGDHAKNILEEVIYISDAVDVRHQRS